MSESSIEDIEAQIIEKMKHDAEIKDQAKEKGKEVVDYLRSIAPVGHVVHKLKSGYVDAPGDYAASIHLEDRERKDANGMPVFTAISRDYKAHWIEYGTGGDSPTPEFACAQRTTDYFNAEEGTN